MSDLRTQILGTLESERGRSDLRGNDKMSGRLRELGFRRVDRNTIADDRQASAAVSAAASRENDEGNST